jgi:hypothetical protein
MIRYLYASITIAPISVGIRMRSASVPRAVAAAIAVAAAAVFCSLELAGKPPGVPSNPLELRAKNHTLSLTAISSITRTSR